MDPNTEFMRRLMVTFRGEAEEHLNDIVSTIVLLEQARDGVRAEFMHRLLKTLHTLKGAARAVDMTDLEALCHALEGVFSAVEKSAFVLGPDHFDIFHRATDVARRLVDEPSAKDRNQAVAMNARLEHLSEEMLTGAVSPKAAHDFPNTAAADAGPSSEPGLATDTLLEIEKSDVIRVQGKSLDAIRFQMEALLTVELGLQHQVAELFKLADEMADQRERLQFAGVGIEPVKRRRQAESSRAMPSTQAGSSSANDENKGYASEQEKGELSFERRCRHMANAISAIDRNFMAIRSKLMDATVEATLVPFSSALDQLPGLIRNMARGQGKEVVLSSQGESILIDRRILDAVREALMHLVTNAIDHGIEPMERRLAAGKPAAGQLSVKVVQLGSNQVMVTIADDGAGIDVDAVMAAAVKAGNLKTEQVAGLGMLERLHLALHAGVSTAAEVTKVSGRGMGLAIVAEKVAAVDGEMLIENSPGAGCTFKLRLPMRLAGLRGLVLRIESALYVLPLSGVEAVVALKDGDIQTVNNRETLVFKASMMPVIRLGQCIGLRRHKSTHSFSDGVAVIARTGGHLFAILVDEIVAEQEVVTKSLGMQLRRVRCIAGATQLGDGNLVPILALEDIAKYWLLSADAPVSMAPEPAHASIAKHVLVVEDSITSRLLLKHILEGAGYRVETAVDGLEALSKIRVGAFDAVVSDIEMPQMDGLALTASIRSNPKTEQMPVILVTSLQSPEEKERGLHAGADAYVIKGAFDQDNLLATIRRLI